jgi:hypothetical protein
MIARSRGRRPNGSRLRTSPKTRPPFQSLPLGSAVNRHWITRSESSICPELLAAPEVRGLRSQRMSGSTGRTAASWCVHERQEWAEVCGNWRENGLMAVSCLSLRSRGFEVRELCRLSFGVRRDEVPRADHRDHPLDVVGQKLECHLGSDVLQAAHLEMGRAHPGLDHAERVLDGGSAEPHPSAPATVTVLHLLDQVLVIPARGPRSLPVV